MSRNVAELIERVRAIPRSRSGDRRLASMLRQGAPHFRGLSPGEVDQIRGHILASFEHRELPADAVHALKEELRTSLSPIVLAGAARAARELILIDPECRNLLVAASARLEVRDEIVRLGSPDRPAMRPARTAREEIASTLALREVASGPCCGAVAPTRLDQEQSRAVSLCPTSLGRIVVEDQFGRQETLLSLLRGRVSLIAFFYTRCMNPAKCSLTISRLAKLASAASAHPGTADLGVFAITYDPEFDVAARLRGFGQDRNFPFSEHARLLRCDAGWENVRRMFDLQVGYTAATVNSHARELFVVSDRLHAAVIACERLSDAGALLHDVAETDAGFA